jgi:hypothetical protein
MKHLKILLPVLSLVMWCSCEKVIDLDLNQSSPAVVIEGDITNETGPYTIRITQSINFDDRNEFPPVSDAVVTVSDSEGNRELLTEVSPGVYETQTTEGIPGRTYTLEVVVNNRSYTAASTMPDPVSLQDLSIEEGGFIGETEREVVAWFQDAPGQKNYYRFRASNGSLPFSRPYAFEDKAYDGAYIRYAIEPDENSDELRIEAGDSIAVELLGVDRHVHLYFLTLSQYTGEGPPTSPANPISNISSGALGYFSAHTISRKTIIVE